MIIIKIIIIFAFALIGNNSFGQTDSTLVEKRAQKLDSLKAQNAKHGNLVAYLYELEQISGIDNIEHTDSISGYSLVIPLWWKIRETPNTSLFGGTFPAIDEIENAFRLCREVGINTVAYFMIGTPVERTRQDVLDTIEYSIRLKPDFVMYNILTPFPGTTLYDEGVRDGVLNLDPWTDFMKNPTEEFKAQVWDEHFTRDELRDLLHYAYRRFYWRPRFVARNVFQIRNIADLKRKATAGLRLLVS